MSHKPEDDANLPRRTAPENARSYSLSIRLQRVVTEYAYVAVPVTEAIIDPQPDGTGRVNTDRMWAAANVMGQAESVRWFREGVEIQPHPIQKAPEPEER